MKKKFIFVIVVVLGISVTNFAVAYTDTEYEATNCTFTDYSSDGCYASTGSQNVIVTSCKPGSTDCNYVLPPANP